MVVDIAWQIVSFVTFIIFWVIGAAIFMVSEPNWTVGAIFFACELQSLRADQYILALLALKTQMGDGLYFVGILSCAIGQSHCTPCSLIRTH